MILAPTLSINGSYGLATVEYNAVVVSGAGTATVDGTYTVTGESFGTGKPYYNLAGSTDEGQNAISWLNGYWTIWGQVNEAQYSSTDDVAFPWQVTTWTGEDGGPPMPTLTPATV